MMEIKIIEDKNEWENFLLECEEKTFLHSFNWGEFQAALGNKIWRFFIMDDNKVPVAAALVIMVSAKRGRFLLLPHGPVLLQEVKDRAIKTEILKALLQEIKRISEKERVHFLRIAPIWERTQENEKIFKELGFKTAPIHIHPELTWELDIDKPEKELLMGMRKTTRYLIRKALKTPDLYIKKSETLNISDIPEKVEEFWQVYKETFQRHKFVPFSIDYLKKEVEAFFPDNQILILSAKYKKECLASAMIIFWQGMAFYHQGASSQKYPKIPAAYLLQWEAIREAKKRGCFVYNFWGIADVDFSSQDPKIKKHPWWGLSLFKMGFGGRRKEYVKTKDLPLSFRYYFVFAFEKLRSIKRGFC